MKLSTPFSPPKGPTPSVGSGAVSVPDWARPQVVVIRVKILRRRFPQGWLEGGQMPLQRRLPKRGFVSLTNDRNVEVRLSEINDLQNDEIDLLTLKQANLVTHALSAKVILSGEITRKVTLKGVGATKGAKAAIEAAGGSVAE